MNFVIQCICTRIKYYQQNSRKKKIVNNNFFIILSFLGLNFLCLLCIGYFLFFVFNQK